MDLDEPGTPPKSGDWLPDRDCVDSPEAMVSSVFDQRPVVDPSRVNPGLEEDGSVGPWTGCQAVEFAGGSVVGLGSGNSANARAWPATQGRVFVS